MTVIRGKEKKEGDLNGNELRGKRGDNSMIETILNSNWSGAMANLPHYGLLVVFAPVLICSPSRSY